jgi:hypothetical protein
MRLLGGKRESVKEDGDNKALSARLRQNLKRDFSRLAACPTCRASSFFMHPVGRSNTRISPHGRTRRSFGISGPLRPFGTTAHLVGAGNAGCTVRSDRAGCLRLSTVENHGCEDFFTQTAFGWFRKEGRENDFSAPRPEIDRFKAAC